MRKRFAGAILFAAAASLSAQTWPSRFRLHSYNISASGFGGYNTVSSPRATIPFSVVRSDGTMTGTLQLRYPDSLPDGMVHTRTGEVGPYLVLSSPVTVGFHLEFDYIANAATPPQTISSALQLEISSGHTRDENSPCRVVRPSRQHQSGTTTHISDDLECTFSRMIISGVSGGNAPDSPIVVGNFIDFSTAFSSCGICGFLGTVYTEYRTYSPLDLTVSRIEVVQVTQDVENSIRLVADKSTVARVFVGLGNETSVFEPPLVGGLLHGRNASGAPLPGSPLTPRGDRIRAPNRPDRDKVEHSLNFALPPAWTAAGTITLRAEVNPDASVAETDRSNNFKEQGALFLPRNQFRISWFPICYQTPTNCPTDEVGAQARKMRKIYPVGDEGVSYSPIDVPKWTYSKPLTNEKEHMQLTALLRGYYELLNDSTIDQLVGWLPDVRKNPKDFAGYSDGRWLHSAGTGRVAWVMDLTHIRDYRGLGVTANLLAHEVGHNLGLRHTNTDDCGGCKDPNTDWPDPTSGTVHEFGFDPDPSRFYVIPREFFDVMTYRNNPGALIWISPFHYNKLFDGHFRPMRAAEAAVDASYALVTGSAKRDGTGGQLDPVITLTSSLAPPPPSGEANHCIRFSGAAGSLGDSCFALTFHDQEQNLDVDEEPFALRVALPAGATRVALRRGETELASRTASANAPTVTITSPGAGETWDGNRTIRWQGADADGDALTYAVLYSPDGGTRWLPIEMNTTSTEFAFDTREIASGGQILFRLLASDGFRTTEATAGPLTVVAAPLIGAQKEADFGSVKLGAFAEATLLLTNRGEKELTVRAIRSSLGDFTARETFPLVVPSDGNREVTVRFTPAAEGVRAATLSIESDDPVRPVVTASVFGAGLPDPQIAVTPTSLSFGDVMVGGSRELPVRIRNTGRGTLGLLAAGSSNSAFTVTAPAVPVAVPEGAEVVVTVRFRPVAGGAQTGTLSLVGTAVGSPLTTVALSGTGTGTGMACAQSVSPANFSIPAQGGTGSVTVSAPAGCNWTGVPNRDWVTLASGPAGSGNGTLAFSIGPNSGSSRSAVLAIGDAAVVIAQAGGVDTFVVPAVASTPGALGSFFKTAVQLHNPTAAPISGDLTYHPGGVSPTAEDPALNYELAPGQTVAFADLLPEILQSGLGSVDLLPRTGTVPVATIRIFNDAGEAGTTGMTEELVRPGEALEAGKRGVLIAPPEPSRARFNIGVRSLAFGATIRFTVRDAAGVVRTTGAKFLPASFFAQQTAEAFLGIALLANDTITFEVDAGSAIVYGATTDNTTQDPSLQFARASSSASDPRRTIAAVAAAPGVLDSLFRTTLQIHNPTTSVITGRLIFHPGGFSGTDADPSVTYTLAPGATTSYADVLGAFGRTGLGSLDIVATTGSVPLAVARVFNDGGARGTTGFSVDAARRADALQSSETGVLIAPADPAATRFNVGIRTFDAGASLSVTIRDRTGQVVRTFTKIYAPNYFEQQAGTTFLGAAPGPSESISVRIDAGSAIVYGAATDNTTQDPAIQIARAIGR